MKLCAFITAYIVCIFKHKDKGFIRNRHIDTQILCYNERFFSAKLLQSLTEYRREHQRMQDRKEFDLYDPDSMKKDKPARESDEDQRSIHVYLTAHTYIYYIYMKRIRERGRTSVLDSRHVYIQTC